jgi:hypothetical protein
MHFLQRSTHFSKTCCNPFAASFRRRLGSPFFSWLEKPRNRMGGEIWTVWGKWIGKWTGGTPPEHPSYSPHLAPIRFLGFSNHEKGAPRLEISKWSAVCSKFSRSGWSVVRSASLPKGGTSKKRPSPHLNKVLTRRNTVSPRTFQTALVKYEYYKQLVLIRNYHSAIKCLCWYQCHWELR